MKTLTEQDIQEFKDAQLNLITKVIIDKGQLPPLGAAMLHDKISDTFEVGFIPVPNQFLESAESKDYLAEKLFPSIFKSMEHGDFKEIVMFAWSTEIWVRESRKPVVPENWKDLPKKEGVMMHLETKDGCEVIVKLVEREGNVVNEDGELIDKITLVDHPGFAGMMDGNTGSIEGRFSRVLRNYLDSK